jgi:hypothetical protein
MIRVNFATIISPVGLVACLMIFSSCSSLPENAERGPDGTIAYYVEIEASEPDVRIEANDDYLGKAPLTWKLFADPDGTFHNFGSFEYIVRATSSGVPKKVQTKVFRAGGWFREEDRVPKKLFFDMDAKSVDRFTVDPE